MHRHLLSKITLLLTPVLLLFTSLLFLLSACTPEQNPIPSSSIQLTPYATTTRSSNPATGTVQTPEGLVAGETPLPSPTPFTYTIKTGDTISSIALKFGVSMDDLQAANPEVSPNSMSIGQVIKIPSSPDNPSGEPTPTPAPFTVQQIGCHPTADQGMWCFVLVHNDLPDPLENISAQITLVDASNASIASQTAFLPLNILPPNTSLPLAVFFPPDIPYDVKPQVQILTAIRLLPDDQRYLPAAIDNTLVQIDADGLSAQVTGQVYMPADAKNAATVWVAATAYDETGDVVGTRRWEWNGGLAAGGNLPFEFMLSSIGGKISSVDFAVEARP
jgi:LysM repeat protein